MKLRYKMLSVVLLSAILGSLLFIITVGCSIEHKEHIHTAECGHNEHNEGLGQSMEAKIIEEKTFCMEQTFLKYKSQYSDKELTNIIIKQCGN